MRLCERVLNTPGKTGRPGHVKPAPLLKYAQFSIKVFSHLWEHHGWSLLTHDWSTQSRRRWVIEVFLSSAWTLLGWKRLTSRPRTAAKIEPWRRTLVEDFGFSLPDQLSHDEIQSAVVLPLGQALVRRKTHGVVLAGVDPLYKGGQLFEGLIANPRRA
jgi:hypothetical protein